ncbi:Aspartyl aminopeptidase [Hondaea fermentalgiana]|uniref:aspartyl aminopeptidase n=1 Tax=Hondaea fermentalgiana TaxID=2315210 RepID=A0A2R5GCX8_9STRA|nr:Aspartyl aminopeptidase [Hondaea fermentalgiana]|eukprot:GBG28826.1 Aspartyl aminopeptidase [Hondaea fermentalgiana]
MGSKSGSKRRKRTKPVPYSQEEIVRRVRLLVLSCKSSPHRAGAVLALVSLLIVIHALHASRLTHGVGGLTTSSLPVGGAGESGGVSHGEDDASKAIPAAVEALPPLERLQRDLGGFGRAVSGESKILRKVGLETADVGSLSASSLTRVLTRMETSMNEGWNQTEVKVQPLGQAGYVKRDLPVYKDGFSREDMTVLPRAKDGIYSVSQLRGSTYNVIVCLSFNTDHCFDPKEFVSIGKTRKVNRIQALRDVLWSKHKFCRTISGATEGIQDQDLLSFTFPCWVMPTDYSSMMKFARDNDVNRFISKPRSLGAGMGIYIVDSREALENERLTQNVVQTYLDDPHLIRKPGIDGTVANFKWDMRSYVLCTSVYPLRAYVYNRGLVRISTSAYTPDCKNHKEACLTNTSINKKIEGAQLKDITWSFKKLSEYLAENNQVDFHRDVFPRMQRAIGMALLSGEAEFLRHMEPDGFHCENCYQLLGVDLLFDASLEPRVVEINGEPSLRLTGNGKTHYDFTKRYMARDLVSLVFNQESVAAKLSPRLAKWAQAVGGKGADSVLGADHVQYALATFREHARLGGFRPVYPHAASAEAYGRFLRHLRDTEAAKTPVDPKAAHADGRRFRIHQIMTLLQDSKALADITPEMAASSKTDSSSSSTRKRKSSAAASGTEATVKRLESCGFTRLREDSHWANAVKPNGRYFFTRNASTIVAFTVGGQYQAGNPFKVVGAHTDSPALKVKPVSRREKSGYLQVGVECYGGGLWHTWFDRDLGVAGRAIVRTAEGKYKEELVHIKKPVLRVPNLAIHLQTAAERSAFQYNKEDHLTPILGVASETLNSVKKEDTIEEGAAGASGPAPDKRHAPQFLALLAAEIGCKPEDIVDLELTLADTQGAAIGGLDDAFIFSPRLDNQMHCFTSIEALAEYATEDNIAADTAVTIVALFDHEECGSQSNVGAGSPIMRDTMERISGCFTEPSDLESHRIALAKSFVISADGAHAVHPNYASKHEMNHAPKMNGGTVIKINDNQRYTTTGVTGFFIRELARRANVPIQEFVVRNDCPCGSTIGPMIAALTGCRAVDLGVAQLSMHSCREQCAVEDLFTNYQLLSHFFADGVAVLNCLERNLAIDEARTNARFEELVNVRKQYLGVDARCMGREREVSAQVPAFDSGPIYPEGICYGGNGGYISLYFIEYTGLDETQVQEAIDLCFSTFGNAIIAVSIVPSADSAVACHYDNNNVPDPATGWENYPSAEPLPISGGNSELSHFTCYDLFGETCSAQVVAAVDRTYNRKFLQRAKDLVTDAYAFVGTVASSLTLSNDLRFGILDVNRYSVDWRVDIESDAAADATQFAAALVDLGITDTAASISTEFWDLFQGFAEMNEADVPSHLLFVTDGRLINWKNTRFYRRLVRRVKRRLGDNAPTIICYRISGQRNTRFLDSVCDSTYYPGMDGLTLAEIATNVVDEICAAPAPSGLSLPSGSAQTDSSNLPLTSRAEPRAGVEAVLGQPVQAQAVPVNTGDPRFAGLQPPLRVEHHHYCGKWTLIVGVLTCGLTGCLVCCPFDKREEVVDANGRRVVLK